MDFDTTVKTAIYETIAETGSVPDAGHVAATIQAPVQEVQAAFERLQQKRLLLLEPGDPSRIRMAPPFSGVPTSFLVHARGRGYYANCVWDAYGVAAALHCDAVIDASDGHTGEPMILEIRGGQPVPVPGVAHFAVPAAKWWDDLIFT